MVLIVGSNQQWCQSNICTKAAEEASHRWDKATGAHHERKKHNVGGKIGFYCEVKEKDIAIGSAAETRTCPQGIVDFNKIT